MGGCGVTHSDNGGPVKCMQYYCWWRSAHSSLSLVQTNTHIRAHIDTHSHRHMLKDTCKETHVPAPGLYTHQCEHTHTRGRYNMINGGVSLTLINYNQIKDFISLNLGSVFGHTVNQRCMIFALHDFPFFFSVFSSCKSLL